MKQLGMHIRSDIIYGGDKDISNELLLELLNDTLRKGASFRFKAKGNSMIPFIRDGDTLTIRSSAREKPKTGKVAAFIVKDTQKLVVHRIVRIQKGKYCLKGDNSYLSNDGWVNQEDILGCVSKVERKGRTKLFGLGPERRLIAYLSKQGLLIRLYRRILNLYHNNIEELNQ